MARRSLMMRKMEQTWKTVPTRRLWRKERKIQNQLGPRSKSSLAISFHSVSSSQ
jgi:hypothetical protein